MVADVGPSVVTAVVMSRKLRKIDPQLYRSCHCWFCCRIHIHPRRPRGNGTAPLLRRHVYRQAFYRGGDILVNRQKWSQEIVIISIHSVLPVTNTDKTCS